MKSDITQVNSGLPACPQYHEQLLLLQRDTLESVAIDNNHKEQLYKLCRSAETILPNSVASIMLFDSEEANSLTVRCAPSIPEEAVEQLNGLTPGPHAGSCGNAVYCGNPVYVENTMTDDRWRDSKQFAINFNINACWSNPIRTNEKIIGSFALSSFETRKPNKFQRDLLAVCAHLTSVILQREKMEQDLQYLAYFDGLTRLPNRDLFNKQLTHAIDKASRNNSNIALLYIDVDNFKYINDSFGHATGDTVLSMIATSLKQSIRDSDCLARIGGDEFVILLEDLNDPLLAGNIAKKALDEVNSNKEISRFNTSISIGISSFPDDAHNQQDMLRNADTAMYAAKSSGKNQLHFYKPELTSSIKEQVEMVNDLKIAIEEDQFVIHYQPIFRSTDLSIHGVEALIRWQHPEKGLVPPIQFIPIAEKHGLIGKITQWVIKRAFKQVKSWLDHGIELHRISINLSVVDVQAGFHKKIEQLLKETQFPSEHLQFEITETILMEHGLAVITELEKIRKLGVMIAIDDFGTGYSSLNQIKRLPVDKLKIDRSFIQDIPNDEDDVTLTKMILSLSQHLSLSVIAEGVETEEQAELLRNEGCEYLQGYLYAKPMPANELLTLLVNSGASRLDNPPQ